MEAKKISVLLLIITFIIFVSCSSTKKVVRDNTETKTETEISEITSIENFVTIDTTKISDLEIVYTRTEYFRSNIDSTKITNDSLSNKDKKQDIKSVEVVTIKKKTENKGIVEQKTETDKIVNTKVVEEVKNDIKVKEKSKPFQIKYLFYILIFVAAIAAYFKFFK